MSKKRITYGQIREQYGDLLDLPVHDEPGDGKRYDAGYTMAQLVDGRADGDALTFTWNDGTYTPVTGIYLDAGDVDGETVGVAAALIVQWDHNDRRTQAQK